MALKHADNFNIYGSGATGTSNMVDGVYADAEGTPTTDPDGISTTLCLNLTTGSGNTRIPFRYVLQDGAVNTCGMAWRMWHSSLPNSGDQDQFRMLDGSNNEIARLSFTSTGAVAVYLAGGTSYVSTVPVITAAGWYHIEWKYTYAGVNLASFEVRIEGITVLAQTNVTNTGKGQIYQVGGLVGAISHFFVSYMKDLVVWDGTGTNNNDFLGSVLVTNLTPTADVSLNWTPNTGTTGYEILDNIPPNDAQYIDAANPPPAAYVGEMSNLPADVTSVKGLITFVRAAKTDGGDGSLQVSLISDPSGMPATIDGANRPITVAQTYWRDVFEVDPKTSAAWLPSAVDAARIKINRTT